MISVAEANDKANQESYSNGNVDYEKDAIKAYGTGERASQRNREVAGGRDGPGGAYTKTMQSVPLPKKLQGAHQDYQTKSFDKAQYITIGVETGLKKDKNPSGSQMGIHASQVAR